MRITLRSLVLALAVLATAAFTTKTASAAAATATVHVPFNFDVNGKMLPAGDYSVSHDLDRAFVTLKSEDGKQAYTWYAAWDSGLQHDPHVTLRFDEREGAFSLESVRYEDFKTSKLDKHTSEVHAIHIVHGR